VQPVCFSQANLMLFRTCSNFGTLLHSQRKFAFCFVNLLKPSGTYMYHQFNTNSRFCPHSVFMCFVWISEQRALISLYSISWLVCVTDAESVYCAVRAQCLCMIQVNRTYMDHFPTMDQVETVKKETEDEQHNCQLKKVYSL